MKLRLLAAMIAACGAFTSPPTAKASGSQTGNSLWTYCQAPNGSPAWSLCVGYITGAADAFGAEEGIMKRSSFICEPPDTTVGQIVDVVKNDLRDRPQDRSFDAASLVWGALSRAWPCPKNSN